VTEFRVSPNHIFRRDQSRRIRVVLWSIVASLIVIPLSAIALFVHYRDRTPSYLAPSTFVWFCASLVVVAIGAAYYAAFQNGLQKLKRETAFALTEQDLVRKRSGWPDVRIGLSEVKTLYERNGWLVVESAEPLRRIAISNEVGGFATLRAELAKHRAISDPPTRSPLQPLKFVFPLASILCWILVLTSHQVGVVRIAGVSGLILYGWSSYQLGSRLRENPKRLFVWMFLAVGWAVMTGFVYLQVKRLHN
jgi:hypothetical protein